MSDKILAVIDPEVASFEQVKEQLQSIRDNFLTLQKDSLKGAAQVLAFTSLGADVSVPETTPTTKGLKTSITTSGGLIMLFAVALVETQGVATATTTVQLTLDGEVKAQQDVGLLNVYRGVACMPWAGSVGAGVHVIDMLFQTDAGSSLVHGGLTPETYLVAVEFII